MHKTPPPSPSRRWAKLLSLVMALALIATACGSDDQAADGQADSETITIGAIPDQDPEILARNYDQLAEYLSQETGLAVNFEPVTAYDAAVSAFRVGDLDIAWFGGLTGVQARLQVEGAEAFAQRDIDAEFTSVFIASADSDLEPFNSVDGLSDIAGRTLTFGSTSSTSGRLMPQFFLESAGVTLDDLDGDPGFSGAHDATIALVSDGAFEVGALNSQVWRDRLEAGEVDTSQVKLLFETPTYFDYHWVSRPDVSDDAQQLIFDALASLDPNVPAEAELLDFFGTDGFIPTSNENYDSIEDVGRSIGQIEE